MSTNNDQLEYFARCASGFEQTLAQELKALGLRRVRPLKGGVATFGTLLDGYKACLWSRVATRIQLVLARVDASDADALYRSVYGIAWEQLLLPGTTIAVDAHGENQKLRNTRFTALKVKDALCDRLRDKRGTRPNVDAADPDFSVNVAVHQQRATIYLNLSGSSLHRRGYRENGTQTQAPLKETLAAGILLTSGWTRLAQDGGAFADPMCGSGTLAIEAALIAANVAPGLLRRRWGFEGWTGHDEGLWNGLVASAREQALPPAGRPRIVAGDLDPAAISIAKANAERAGVGGHISFFVDDAANLARHLRGVTKQSSASGLMAANPPYGIRLSAGDELTQVYESLSAAVQALPANWQLTLISPDAGIDSALGLVPSSTLACHNGPIETWVRSYDSPSQSRQTLSVVSLAGVQRSVAVAETGSQQFASRLRKVAKERTRWAKREGLSAFRVYDADLPEYALSVELYLGTHAGSKRSMALVEERRRPGSVDEQRAARRFADAVALTSAVLDIPMADVVAHPWRDANARSSRQPSQQPKPLTVCEDELCFDIDLAARPDTGLPLVQRGLRQLVASLSDGSRVANLFATSGAATVYTAKAATSTVSIDVFEDRLGQIGQNMATNGLAGTRHKLMREDARIWLSQEAAKHHAYDLVICVPPARMPAIKGSKTDKPWELQRDHVDLLRAASNVLSKQGQIVFACNANKFKLNEPALRSAGLLATDVSAKVLPHDFERSAKDFCCYLICRKGAKR